MRRHSLPSGEKRLLTPVLWIISIIVLLSGDIRLAVVWIAIVGIIFTIPYLRAWWQSR